MSSTLLTFAGGNEKAKHRKNYSPVEEAKRKALHKARSEKVKQHNLEHAKGKHAYQLAVNHLTDWVFLHR